MTRRRRTRGAVEEKEEEKEEKEREGEREREKGQAHESIRCAVGHFVAGSPGPRRRGCGRRRLRRDDESLGAARRSLAFDRTRVCGGLEGGREGYSRDGRGFGGATAVDGAERNEARKREGEREREKERDRARSRSEREKGGQSK